MYLIFGFIVFITTAPAAAQGATVTRENQLIAEMNVAGLGKYICVAEDSFQKFPVLARGRTLKEAKALALKECATQNLGKGFFCQTVGCEQDTNARAETPANFDVVRDEKQVQIGWKGNAKHICHVKGWEKEYSSVAPTRIEAMALAKAICADDEGIRRSSGEPNGFFCKGNITACESLHGTKAKLKFKDILDLFGVLI